jgi:hypothetical protein
MVLCTVSGCASWLLAAAMTSERPMTTVSDTHACRPGDRSRRGKKSFVAHLTKEYYVR